MVIVGTEAVYTGGSIIYRKYRNTKNRSSSLPSSFQPVMPIKKPADPTIPHMALDQLHSTNRTATSTIIRIGKSGVDRGCGNPQDVSESTALIEAIESYDMALYSSKARLDIEDSRGRTAVYMAHHSESEMSNSKVFARLFATLSKHCSSTDRRSAVQWFIGTCHRNYYPKRKHYSWYQKDLVRFINLLSSKEYIQYFDKRLPHDFKKLDLYTYQFFYLNFVITGYEKQKTYL